MRAGSKFAGRPARPGRYVVPGGEARGRQAGRVDGFTCDARLRSGRVGPRASPTWMDRGVGRPEHPPAEGPPPTAISGGMRASARDAAIAEPPYYSSTG